LDARHTIDVDQMPGELHRLMPLLARTLADAGIADPDLGRLRGVRQYAWYRNQRLFANAGAVASALSNAGVRPLLLRGAATALRGYGDVGLRPMNDLDLLVAANAVDAAERDLREAGWRPRAQAPSRREFEGAVAYANAEGHRVLLHWRPSRNLPGSPAWWAAGSPVSLGGTEIGTLDNESHLLQVIVDGARALSGSNLRWVADATVLVRVAEPDWERLVTLARQLHTAHLIADALSYLRDALSVPVPDDAIGALRAGARPSPRSWAAHRLSSAEVPRLGRLPELLGRYLRLSAGEPLTRAILTFPSFVQGALGVDSAKAVPAALTRRTAAAARARMPRAAR
jgi:hypothetical protein